MAKPLYVDPEKFDDVQREILDVGFGVEERNCIVQGCAGCGKSCIAMNMFVNLCARGNRKPVIVTNQRALINAYLRELRSLSDLAAAEYVRAAQNGAKESWFSKNTAINTFNREYRKECSQLMRQICWLMKHRISRFRISSRCFPILGKI